MRQQHRPHDLCFRQAIWRCDIQFDFVDFLRWWGKAKEHNTLQNMCETTVLAALCWHANMCDVFSVASSVPLADGIEDE